MVVMVDAATDRTTEPELNRRDEGGGPASKGYPFRFEYIKGGGAMGLGVPPLYTYIMRVFIETIF